MPVVDCCAKSVEGAYSPVELERLRASLEESVYGRMSDFSALYVSVCDLRNFCREYPDRARPQTTQALKAVLESPRHSRQTQSLFLYKEAADTLSFIASAALDDEAGSATAQMATLALEEVAWTIPGRARRAATEALGLLPTHIPAPAISLHSPSAIPSVRWAEILCLEGIPAQEPPVAIGRSLVVPIPGCGEVLAVKSACADDDPEELHNEALWMEFLGSMGRSLARGLRFDVPRPIKVGEGYLFKLDGRPLDGSRGSHFHPEGYSIGFVIHRDYFTYINEPGGNGHKGICRKEIAPGSSGNNGDTEEVAVMCGRGSEDEAPSNPEGFREALFRNAWLLGRLMASGIVHTAPIPLFHNRVQRHRRQDRGLYEWPRGGRLDRWLFSCRYPNIGLTGVRDFEHFACLRHRGLELYHQAGTHLLSLILVAGSYFRNRDSSRVGLDSRGRPHDVRDLFEKPLLMDLLEGLFLHYYAGFAGGEFTGPRPCDLEGLASRMIEEMGVDRHMAEILRAVDQAEMSEEEFRLFFRQRGFSEEETAKLSKGVEDITINTGPHLGGFNERISLPEMIDFVAAASALCIAGRYHRERFGAPHNRISHPASCPVINDPAS